MRAQHGVTANGVLFALTIASCVACANLGIGFVAPEVQVANMIPLESTAFEQRVQIDLRVRNPNRAALEVEGIRFAIDLNGRRLGAGQSGELFVVPALADEIVSLTVTTTLLDLVQQLFALQERRDFGYEIYGDVFLAGHWRPIPFSRIGELSRSGDAGSR